LLMEGNYAEALGAFERESHERGRMSGQALAYHALGRKADADAALAELEKRFAGEAAFELAKVHAYRGETDAALRWLDRAYEDRDILTSRVKYEPLLRNLWPDPRFKAFLRKMKLPE